MRQEDCPIYDKGRLVIRINISGLQSSRQINISSCGFLWCGPAPMAHSYRLGLVAWRYQIRISVGPDICHRGCIYTVLQTVQRPGVYSAVYGTVHYKEPSESFEIKVGHSLGSGFLLSWYCHDCAESDVKQYSYIFISYDVVSAGWRSMSIHNLVWFNHFNSYNTEIFVYEPWRSIKSQLLNTYVTGVRPFYFL